MTNEHPDVDVWVANRRSWRAEIEKLRGILLGCGLDEALKWRKPCYRYAGKNVAIIQPFKHHCALLFFKGALLDDTHGLLKSQGAHTQGALRLEFRSEADIKKGQVASYVKQAIAVEKEGRTVDFKAKRELTLPDALRAAMDDDAALARAFRALTPGRQRGYVLHISGAKQAKTRAARVDRCRAKILAGKGMNDR